MPALNLFRAWKSLVYPWFPSTSPQGHEKRRKGLLYRSGGREVLECQREQDRIFWSRFLRPQPGGTFLEVGGDGATGSHTLGLELQHGWSGDFCEPGNRPRQHARAFRKCRVAGSWQEVPCPKSLDLLSVHRPRECGELFARLGQEGFRPRWVIVENREPDPRWCRLLEGLGYQLRFFFHDDEYYEFKA